MRDPIQSVRRPALSHNRSVRLAASAQRLSSDGGALVLRELDHRLGFTKALAASLMDPRCPTHIDYSLAELLRSRIFLMAQGWHDQSDADRVRNDPALCVAVTDRRGQGAVDQPLASQSTQSRLIDTLALLPNRGPLRWAPTDLAISCRKLRTPKPLAEFTLDLDSTDLETHGSQQGSVYNGHYEHTCFHPLLAFTGETGDLVGAWLRPGNVPSKKGAWVFASRLLDRLEEGGYGKVGKVRGDSAFAAPGFMDRLEDRGTRYVMRLRRNQVLERLAEPFVRRPVGRPPDHVREWTFELEYQAGGWRSPRRVVLVVIDDPKDRFMGGPATGLRTFCLVTNFTAKEMPGPELLAYFRERGTAETRLGEFKNEIQPLLSSPRLAENAATFILSALAYQLAHTLRLLATEVEARPEWYSLSAIRERLLKVAVRFTGGHRRLLASVADTAWGSWQRLFARLALHPA